MDFFDKLGETLVSAGKDVSKKAKDVSAVTKLKLDLLDKQDQLKNYYRELGKTYYEEHKDEAEISNFHFDQIKETMVQIQEIEDRILELKNARRCPKCGAEASTTAEYCSACGERLSIFEEE